MQQGAYRLIADAHLDLAWNALDWNRDLKLPVSEIRRREQSQGMTQKGRSCNTVSFHDLRRGRVGLFIATLLARLYQSGTADADAWREFVDLYGRQIYKWCRHWQLQDADAQVRTQALGLACLNLQGQFEQERGRLLFGVLGVHLPHACLAIERLFQG